MVRQQLLRVSSSNDFCQDGTNRLEPDEPDEPDVSSFVLLGSKQQRKKSKFCTLLFDVAVFTAANGMIGQHAEETRKFHASERTVPKIDQ